MVPSKMRVASLASVIDILIVDFEIPQNIDTNYIMTFYHHHM